MVKDYVFGFNPTKVPESLERPLNLPEVIHGPRPNLVPSQDNKVISYYEEVIRLKRAMNELEEKFAELVKTEIPDYDSTNANDVLSVNEDGTNIEWKPATSASGVSASVEQTETGATITITDASGTTTADVENGKQGDPGFSPSASVEQTDTGATITITDASGATTVDIKNGVGEKGEQGEPGFSPSAKVEQTDTGATVTVTDQSGTTTADLSNGKNGEDGFSPSANVEQLADNEAAIYVTDKSGTTVATVTAPKGNDGFSPEVILTPIPEGYHMKVIDATGEQEVTIADGKDGSVGPTPEISVSASVNESQGTPSVEVTKSGTDEAPAFNFAFSGLKGETGEGTKGDDGFSPVAKVEQTENGATITITDKTGTTTASVENGSDGNTPRVSALASVTDTTGTPSVNVTKIGSELTPVFNFEFSGLKGETGQGTKGDDGFSPIASIQETDTGATITITDKEGTTTANIKNGTDGEQGPTGPVPTVTATATVDNSTGTPSVEVTKTGTNEAPAFNFAFSNIKGADGQSVAGPGVAAGGTAGQVLTKKSATDYDTEWVTPSSGGSDVEMRKKTFNLSIDSIAAGSTMEYSEEIYVDINPNKYEIAFVLQEIKLQVGRGDIVIAGFTIEPTSLYQVRVTMRLCNTGNSIYERSSYPSSPNNVIGAFYAIGVR